MHYTEENKLKLSFNSTTRMEITVKRKGGKHFYVTSISMWLSNESESMVLQPNLARSVFMIMIWHIQR